MTASVLPASRPARVFVLTTTWFLLVAFVLELAWLLPYIGAQQAIGTDHQFYKRIGETWLDTGQFYLPHQLAGAYIIRTDVDVMYPPLAIPFFVALHWLPWPLWYAIPLGVVIGLVLYWRPAAWTWPILALLLAWPRGVSNMIYGNSDMWVMAAIAGGLAIGWPAVFVLLKPSVAPFALVGVRHRSFWIGLAIFAVCCMLTLDLWREYLTAVRNSDAAWYWSLDDMPPLFIPIVAYLGRRQGGFTRFGEVLAWRPSMPAVPWVGSRGRAA
jgi:hypothetical protein